MKNCRIQKKLIHEHLDGTLNEKKTQSLYKHLESCPACKEYYNSMCLVSNSLKSAKINYSIDIKNTVMSKIENIQAPKKTYKKVYYRYAVALSCMAVIIGVYILTGGINNNINKNTASGLDSSDIKGTETILESFAASSVDDFTQRSDQPPDCFPMPNIDESRLTVFNYKTDKTYQDIIDEINLSGYGYNITQVCNYDDQNEISFISDYNNASIIEKKFNLKRDTSEKTNESYYGTITENETITDYVLFVISYSD